jgi:PAS domain S-box-containing protein
MPKKPSDKKNIKALPNATPKSKNPLSPYRFHIIMALVAVVILAGGYMFYYFQAQQMLQRIEDGLSIMAQLKADQIAEWRSARLVDANTLAGSPSFTDTAAKYMALPTDTEISDKILADLAVVEESYPYQDILLTDVNGEVLLSLNDSVHRLGDMTSAQLAVAIKEHKAVFTDFHFPLDSSSPRLNVVAPLFPWRQDPPQAIGAVVLYIEPSRYLYPLVQSSPMPSQTAETLLVERDGDQVLFLNELRHQKDTALKFRIPLSREDVPAVMAVLGKEGVVEGKDYREAEVLAALKHIPDSPWYVVAKIDTSEALAAWRSRSGLIIAFFAGLLVAALSLVGFIWQRRQRLAYQALYQAEVNRKKLEQELINSEAKYRRLFETAQDAILILDGDTGQITDANPFIKDMLGYTLKELRGKNLWEIGTFQDIVANKTAFEELKEKGYIRHEHLPLQTKDGRQIHVEFFSKRYKVDNREVFQCNIRDLTERKLAEEERRQLELKAQITGRLASVGEMAAGVAHEINNPLTAVTGYAQLLVDREDVPLEIRSDLAAINDGARRVAGIVQRLLAFSRQTRPERKLVDINELIESTLILRAYHLRVNNIEIVTQLAPDLLETVADPGQIQQVLLNLIVNAETEMKMAHGKGKLTITTKKSHNTIKICIKDDGPGIKPEVMDRIFDPFFTTREIGQGTGLGLSLCYGIVTEHKGKIYAESQPGKGATFVIELPVVTEVVQPEPTKPDVKKSKKAAKVRILVVDDEQVVRDVVKRVLTGEGHKVEAVDNAADALKKIEGRRYNLILVDIKMPGMNGVELYRRIQRVNKDLARRVVFITGDVMGADTEKFLAETKVAHISKPFDAEQLKRSVISALTELAGE